MIASATPEQQATFLDSLTTTELLALPHLFDFWAMPHQLPPEGDWRAWVILGGRGAGKTRAGAEWVRAMVEGPKATDPGRAKRVGLVAETVDQGREVMVFGESGIMACSPKDRRPDWVAGRKCLVWPNGATAHLLSAHDPEALRGWQFDALWADELAKWKRAGDAWDMLQFGLRLGSDPRACVTTTPRNSSTLRRLLTSPSTVTTHAPTEANAANLAAGFLEEVQRRYAGTRLGRQELDGVLMAEAEGALWSLEQLAGLVTENVPDLDRIVVSVDPAVTANDSSDACGIIVAGAVTKGPPKDWRAWILADLTAKGASPLEWAEAAVAAYHRFGATRLVAEVNQGGALVETLVRQVDPMVSYRPLRASRGKSARAEPVSAIYEQGRVSHVRGLGELEDQMCQMTLKGFDGSGSPDRVDALVWAIHELLIRPADTWRRPRMRVLD